MDPVNGLPNYRIHEYMLFLDEAGDAEYYCAVAVHWTVDDAVVDVVLCSVAHHYSVSDRK